MKTLVKRTPRTFSGFPSLLDELFHGDFTNNFPANRTNIPSVNIKETEEAFELSFAIPGFKKEDIQIELDNELLTVSATVSTEKEETSENYTRKEFSKSSFKRSFNLPESIDEDAIKATQQDGILNIKLPKKEEAKPQAPKRIEVK